MNRILAVSLALVLLVAGGVVHGLYADRWTLSHDLEDGIARVPQVPLRIGDWKGEELPASAEEFAQAGAQAYWMRTYRKADHEILVILMVGRGGRMSIHTPEVCYRGAGYELFGRPTTHSLRGTDGADLGNCWMANFGKPNTANSELQLFWTWKAEGPWQAPTNPRWAFAGKRSLYKLYLSHHVAGLTGSAPTKMMDDFLRGFVPALNETLTGQVPADTVRARSETPSPG